MFVEFDFVGGKRDRVTRRPTAPTDEDRPRVSVTVDMDATDLEVREALDAIASEIGNLRRQQARPDNPAPIVQPDGAAA